jgi:hypothetical protein
MLKRGKLLMFKQTEFIPVIRMITNIGIGRKQYSRTIISVRKEVLHLLSYFQNPEMAEGGR